MRQRFSFWAVLLILLAASPFTAPFQTCGDTLVPENTVTTPNSPNDSARIGPPLEHLSRRSGLTPLSPLSGFGVRHAPELAVLVSPLPARRDPLHAPAQSTTLRI